MGHRVETAIGGMDIDRTIEGRERYTVNVRYPRELRDSTQSLGRVLVPTMDGAQVPLAQLGRFQAVMGPPMIKSEVGSLVGWVHVDVEGRDIRGYVTDAKAAVGRSLDLPTGYSLVWTGQYEFLEWIRQRLQYVIPPTIGIVFAIPYLNFGGAVQTLLVMTSVPLSLIGSIWLMASVMVVYLDEAFTGWQADVAKRIASPMQGGLFSLTVMTLFAIPALYVVWRAAQLRRTWSSPAHR